MTTYTFTRYFHERTRQSSSPRILVIPDKLVQVQELAGQWYDLTASGPSATGFTVFEQMAKNTLLKTRAGVCKTLCPQHLLIPKHGQICSAVIPQKFLDFAQTFNR